MGTDHVTDHVTHTSLLGVCVCGGGGVQGAPLHSVKGIYLYIYNFIQDTGRTIKTAQYINLKKEEYKTMQNI